MNGPSGKVAPAVLRQHVFPYLGQRRSDVLVHSAAGEDAAVIDIGDYVCIVTSDPITGARANAGWLGVHVNCNDVAASGGEPIGVLVTILLPAANHEPVLGQIMRDVERAVVELGIEVVGGHSETTAGIDAPIVAITAIGRAPRGRHITSGGARPGDALLVTKTAGIEGTAILATDFEDELAGQIDAGILRDAQSLIGLISVVPEGSVAAAAGATAMHDATEGGVLGAIHEMAEAGACGLRIRVENIPLHPATESICGYFGIDPLRLISSGAMLIAAPDGAAMVRALADRGLTATVIGDFTEAPDRRLLLRGKSLPLFPPERDELWRVLDERGARS
jgi:hydrogenase expression/formation protein HypE